MGTTSSKNCSIEDEYRRINALLAAAKFGKIEDDYRSIKTLLAAAKNGKWDEVWDIIGTPDKSRKAYLLNNIPAESRWSVLHQAVYWRDKAVIETLLKFDTCDSGVKAKEGTCEVRPAGGNTPRDVAEHFKYNDIATLLKGQTSMLWKQEMATFHFQKHILQNDGLGLLHITIAAYKDVFHPSPISKGVQDLMSDIFKHVDYKNTCKPVRDKISQPLYQVWEDATSILDRCKTKDDFFGKIINVYSCQANQLYTLVNTALRRQMRRSYIPMAGDLAIGPYILMFNLLLLKWDALREETITTYRRMNLTTEDSLQYKVQTVSMESSGKIIWVQTP